MLLVVYMPDTQAAGSYAFHSSHLSTDETITVPMTDVYFSLHKKEMKHVLTGTALALILLCVCAAIIFISPAL